jgi:hypothetical protein
MSYFGLDEAPKVFLYGQPADMRKGFDGLYGLVINNMSLDPRVGYLFVFLNAQRTRIKVLHWNTDGLAIFHKLRPIAIGRKNYLFAASHNGAARSAMFYSFFACCSLNNIHPQKWLEYVLEVIADYRANKLHELLPHNIKPELINNHKPFYELEIV